MITTPTMHTDTSSPNGHVRAVVDEPWTGLVTLRARMNRGDGMAYETPVTIPGGLAALSQHVVGDDAVELYRACTRQELPEPPRRPAWEEVPFS